ncbi:tetratricopeptide repeat protein [Halodesulfovibrio spirochaetisodalis]|uniref:tetratricopeptide repeat protein n=1 Tax=Halodesulfovibrio spirochaetisodalis TaxID=1560234 RepID=UPI00082C8095|nr:tetratricopeptide repeat protein [Halodesulfovibrio spirochaetisodalis]
MTKIVQFFALVLCLCLLSVSLASAKKYTQQECDKYYFSAQYDEAYQCIRSMAKEGDPQSQFNLAVLYHLGQGVKKDTSKTIYWLTRAAENEHPNAQFGVGAAYEAGFGVDKDLGIAAKWYLRAANQGHPAAQTNLGVMYGNGEGVEKNLVEAMKWFRLAASSGSSKAKRNAEVLEQHMSKEDLIEADALAAAWEPVILKKSIPLPDSSVRK